MSAIASPTADAVATRSSLKRWLIAVVLLCLVLTGYLDRISVAVLFTNKDFQTAMGTGFDPALLGMLMTAFFIPYESPHCSSALPVTGSRTAPDAGSRIADLGHADDRHGKRLVPTLRCFSAEFPWASSRVLSFFMDPEGHFQVVSTQRARACQHDLARRKMPSGSAIGFPLIIALVATYGWRTTFYVLAALSILVMAPLLLLVVRDWPQGGASQDRAKKTPRAAEIWRNCGVFLKDTNFWLLVVCDCGELIYLWGLNSWLPTYLQKVRNFDLQHLGIYSSLPFVFLLAGVVILSGYLSDKFGRKAILIFLGLAGAAVSCFMPALLHPIAPPRL